jgi:type I restriction enzyme S subunit
VNGPRLKFMAYVIAGQAPPGETVIDLEDAPDVLPFIQGNAEFGTEHPTPRLACATASKVAEAGDVLVSVRAPVGALNIASGPLGIGRGVAALRPCYGLDRRFIWWAMHVYSDRLKRLGTGSTYLAVTAEDIGSLRLPGHSLRAQRSIAHFLDRECERIDVVDDVRRQLASLAMESVADDLERLFAAGSTTRPVRLHHLLAARPCYGVLVPQLNEAGIPFVRVGDLERINAGQPTVQAAIPASQSAEYRRTVVAAGDVLVSVVGSIDRSTVVPPSLAGANVARAVARLQPKMIPASVLQAWTGTRAYAAQARNATSADTAQPTLNMRDLAVFTVHVPVELRAAECKVAALRACAHRIETTADALRVCLTAYRDSLIHEAVTGKLDVTKASDRQMDERLHAAAEGRLDEVPV